MDAAHVPAGPSCFAAVSVAGRPFLRAPQRMHVWRRRADFAVWLCFPYEAVASALLPHSTALHASVRAERNGGECGMSGDCYVLFA